MNVKAHMGTEGCRVKNVGLEDVGDLSPFLLKLSVELTKFPSASSSLTVFIQANKSPFVIYERMVGHKG